MKKIVIALAAVAAPACATEVKKTNLDINQKVYIENQPVLGDGAGEGALNECLAFSPQFVANPDAPAVKVCGTGVKATFFLRGRCADYYEHQKTLGSCDSGNAPDVCETWSPADDPKFGAYQSYKIEQC